METKTTFYQSLIAYRIEMGRFLQELPHYHSLRDLRRRKAREISDGESYKRILPLQGVIGQSMSIYECIKDADRELGKIQLHVLQL
jgi:hypothetical protein